jgi:hypothetical protein
MLNISLINYVKCLLLWFIFYLVFIW